MALLVGQLIEILQRYDRDREVIIHTLKGETVEVNGYFVQRDLNDNAFGIRLVDILELGDISHYGLWMLIVRTRTILTQS